MTMQVGMIGSGEMLLASDTLWQRSLDRCAMRTWHTSGGYKIKISDDEKLAVSCAMDMCEAYRIADDLLTALRGADAFSREGKIREIALTIRNDLAVECFVAFIDPYPSLFLLQHQKDSTHPIIQPVLEKAFAGDTLNPAVYWAERYYRSLPADKLKNLAAHVIAEAHRLNPALISGLDIVIGKDGKFVRLPRRETDDLMEQSRRWGESFGQVVLP
jgi:hypothetical protein